MEGWKEAKVVDADLRPLQSGLRKSYLEDLLKTVTP